MKKMILSLVFLSVCHQASANIGGIGSGGGGAVNVPAASLDQIKSTLPDARRVLRQWLYGEETLVRTGRIKSDALNLIFGIGQPVGTRTVHQILGSVQIEFHETTSCYDAEGKEDDGSIYTSLPGDAVCISGMRLTQELRNDDFEYQTAALILHEIAHLLGANEAQAVEIQDLAVMGMRRVDFENSRFNTYRIAVSLTVQEQGLANLIRLAAQKSALHDKWIFDAAMDRSVAFETVLTALNNDFDKPRGLPLLSLINYQEIDGVRTATQQILNLAYASCVNEVQPTPCVAAYKKIFAGKATVDVPTFIKAEIDGGFIPPGYWPTSGQFAPAQIPYIKTLKGWLAAAKVADDTLVQIANDATTVANEASFTVVEK